MDDLHQLTREELIARIQRSEAKCSAAGESEALLRAILSTAVEGIITIDAHGLIESMNPAAEQMFGYLESELQGENVSVLMPTPWREEHDQYLANYLQTGKRNIIGIGRMVRGQRKDGTAFPVDLAVSEVRFGDRRLFTGFLRDMTERQEAEAQLAELARDLAEKNKELETIVYVASHDLRSPLVNIQGFSRELAHACRKLQQVLVEGRPQTPDLLRLTSEDIEECLAYIQAGVAKMDSLLSGLLQYSRLGRAALRIEPLSMNSLLAGIERSMEFQIKKAGALFSVSPLPDALGDATQINQVFSNLVENALKYLDPRRRGEITVTGRIEQGQAIFAVKDNGEGIAQAHQGKVFEIFHRLHPGAGEGEGLGLTIVQRILERHRGRIWVESIPGSGSTFYVSLPAVVSASMAS
jgi:PAS domain S-box-containing protein